MRSKKLWRHRVKTDLHEKVRAVQSAGLVEAGIFA